jgi:integration host factor subunit alpha
MPKKVTPLTRAELIQILRDRMSLSTRDAGMILESILDCVIDNLSESTPVSIMGFGRFEVRRTPPRPGRNPKTGDFAPVSGRLRPTFGMSKRVRDKMSFLIESDHETWWNKADSEILGADAEGGEDLEETQAADLGAEGDER